MNEKFDLFSIVSLIWVSAAFYAALILYKGYLNNKFDKMDPPPIAVVQNDEASSKPFSLDKKWGKRADKIKKDHRSLVDSYKQRQRDHRRISKNLFKRR